MTSAIPSALARQLPQRMKKDLSKMEMSLDRFRVFTRGYVRACPGLTAKELELLPMGAKNMTMECGVRFLTDYLDGDHYFAVHRDGQNLDRARTQFKLVADMEKKMGQNAENRGGGSKMNVLVTGGAGYIGSHTCVELIEAGHTPIVIDNLSNSNPESLHRVAEITSKTVEFIEGDVRDEALLEKNLCRA